MRAPVLVVLVAIVATLSGGTPRAGATGTSPPQAEAEPVRILLLGDSVTQGSSGDWTWRYRLWQHLTDAGVAFDLVGHRDDLQKLGVQGATSQAYADPHFDRDHAARWGMWAGFLDVPIATLMADHQPDVVVVMLGVNDLLWSADPASTVVTRMGSVVDRIRQGNPDVKVVLAAATQSWFADVPEFNEGLETLAPSLSTPASPVVFADVASGYEVGENTWDGSHPNARGEVRIAASVADALASIGVGPPAERPLVLPAVGPLTAATISAAAGSGRQRPGDPGLGGPGGRDDPSAVVARPVPDHGLANGRLGPSA